MFRIAWSILSIWRIVPLLVLKHPFFIVKVAAILASTNPLLDVPTCKDGLSIREQMLVRLFRSAST